jgi:large subunit ribosomal protein L13
MNRGGRTLKTFIPKTADIDRKWYVVDAEGMVLGRLASEVANILRGKNKPIYTPNMDTGDYVIIVNADKVVLTGKKLDQKIYYHHSGYAGGLKETKYRKLLAEKPEFAVRHAVVGMLPKGPLGRQMAKKLKIFAGTEHGMDAQKPEVLNLKK